jgi:HEAT repeat protein
MLAIEALGKIRSVDVREALLPMALRHDDLDTRRAAIESILNIMDASTVDALIAALEDENSLVRLSAMEVLERVDEFRSLEPLVHVALYDRDKKVREYAAWVLASVDGRRAVESLDKAFKSDDVVVRKNAVEAMEKIRFPGTVNTMIAALKDDDPEVREVAARALGEVRNPRTVAPLIDALRDDDQRVRGQIASSLKLITLQDFGEDPDAWAQWLESKK